jgi:replicative DNA helicase
LFAAFALLLKSARESRDGQSAGRRGAWREQSPEEPQNRSKRPDIRTETITTMVALARLAPDSTPEQPLRLAPHNLEAEQALLGAILVNNEAFDRVSDFLQPEHFYEKIHGAIFDVMGKLLKAGKVATPITIKTYLPDVDLGGITVAQYLGRLAAAATTISNAGEYGRTVHDLALRRTLITIGEDMAGRAYDAPVEDIPRQQIEEAERKLYALAESGRFEGGFQSFSSALTLAIQMASEAYKRDGGLSGTATGLSDLDQRMGGLQRSDLIILAGRPGMGKTALATNIAYNIARAWRGERQPDGLLKTVSGGIVGFFSLEMSAEQLATRIIAEQSGVPSFKIRRGDVSSEEFGRLHQAVAEMQSIPLHIDQSGGISIAQLAARARRLKRQHGLDLLVVDYLQLLSGASKKGENRVQELTEITTGMKALAKELNVPIIALSQLSRQVENRDDKRPQLSDLRESGSIEQDADVVMFVYREEYYLNNREPKPGSEEHLKWQQDMERVHGKAEVIIGKQRHGPTGTVQLQFEANITRFSDLAKEDYLPERLE